MSKSKSLDQSALFETKVVVPVAEPARPIAYHVTPNDLAPFEVLLKRYADGCEVRGEIVTLIWQWNDPLQRMIIAALEAAERHGAWKTQNF